MNVCILQMLYLDRIDVSEGTDVNKASNSEKCHVCQYLYFLNKGFKFQSNVSNRCHDLLMMSMNISGMAVLSIEGSDYRSIISEIRKWGHKLNAKYQFTEKSRAP